MNDRLIQSFIDRAVNAVGKGQKAHTLVSLVAEHCAMICESVAQEETEASQIIRAAMVPDLTPKQIAQAARESLN